MCFYSQSNLTEMTIRESQIALFDLDGTLSLPRLKVEPSMIDFLKQLRKVSLIGIVSGSDLTKINEQLGCPPFELFDYVFSENGVQGYFQGNQIISRSIAKELGEPNLKQLINFVLHYIADLDIPIKRGTFIEYRLGMLNFSPIGRNCSQQERLDFYQYDKEHKIRQEMVKVLEEKFGEKLNLKFSIGGQISIDCFIKGWDKRFCLQHFDHTKMKIHFFGDRTDVGGNDHEIFSDDRTVGHTVVGPADTIQQCKEIFNI
jgi:phosphomannomutase